MVTHKGPVRRTYALLADVERHEANVEGLSEWLAEGWVVVSVESMKAGVAGTVAVLVTVESATQQAKQAAQPAIRSRVNRASRGLPH